MSRITGQVLRPDVGFDLNLVVAHKINLTRLMVYIMSDGSCFLSACPDSLCGTMFRQLIQLLFGQNQSANPTTVWSKSE